MNIRTDPTPPGLARVLAISEQNAKEAQDPKNYVLGFAFGHEFYGTKKVLLIRKTKPDWMAGMVNGIGGKIEENETSLAAMVREFKEERGIETGEGHWTHFARLVIPGGHVDCFTTQLMWNEFKMGATKTEEEVVQVAVQDVWSFMPMRNLAWLVPMAEAACADASEFPLVIS